jgi:hypothetical protein
MTALLPTITAIIVTFLTYICSPYITEYAKRKFSKVETKTDDIVKVLDIAKLISTKLDSIRFELNVDRVLISQFHNGGNFIPSGQGMKKFSITYECLKIGIDSIKHHYQQTLLTLYHKYIHNIEQNRFVEVNFIEHNAETYDIHQIGEFHGIKTRYAFAIYTLDNIFAGFLELDFIDSVPNLTDKQVIKLQQDVGAIGGILTKEIKK